MSEKSTEPNKLRPIYFQPGQLIFHVYGNLLDLPEVTQELIDWANKLAPNGVTISASDDIFDFNPAEKTHLTKQNLYSESKAKILRRPAAHTDLPIYSKDLYEPPPVKIPPPFSLVFAKIESEKWPEFLINSKHTETDADAKEQVDALSELLDLAILLDNRRNEAPIELVAVSPNWLIGGSPSSPGGTGGPGGKPSPVDTEDINKYHIFPKSAQNAVLPSLFREVSQPDGGNGVVVAILDTAYKPEQLEEFYKTWVLDRTGESHPILQALLSNDPAHPGALREANGQLRVHPDPAVDDYLPGLIIDGHDYDMTDHGLFIAGIINSIAPKAELHLYQVLNQYGLGDLRSIALALQQVMNDFQGRQLVVNMSLTMNLPLEEGHLKTDDQIGMGRAILKRRPWWLARLVSRLFNWLFKKQLLCCCDSWFERQARSFEWICDMVYALDSRVIAAAGNESKNRNQRPSALYPAAFDRVFGVGALPRDNSSVSTTQVLPASYSNVADKPASKGITTLGGEPGEKKGILGVYVGKFPDGRLSETGWAWWSGTSFATPIISGITAAVLSIMPPGSPSEAAIRKLFQAQTFTTPDGEDVFLVTQE